MNGTLKAGPVLSVVALALALSACSGGEDPPPASAAASPAATVTETASPAVTVTVTEPVLPEPTGEASPVPLPQESRTNFPGGRGLDENVTGQVTIKGADSILVQGDDAGERTAQLVPYTEVLDVQGGICDEGPIPRSCSVDQLRKALREGVSLYAKISIKDGVAVRIEEIVRN
ncbi:hypothetical protein ACFOWE_05185 [Planomonospora corallina]|uniref:Lipoprotein n=1 Tax=Planomonospora corallina TaxID=1806052 RepID=A0ABV8I6W2_9ACTN